MYDSENRITDEVVEHLKDRPEDALVILRCSTAPHAQIIRRILSEKLEGVPHKISTRTYLQLESGARVMVHYGDDPHYARGISPTLTIDARFD